MTLPVIITLVVSIIGVIFASITAPLIIAHRTEQIHHDDRIEDYARQDRVARAAADAATAAQEAAAAALVVSDEASRKIDGIGVQTRRIHSLVNSEMTAARQAELAQAEKAITALRKVIAMSEDRKMPVDPGDTAMLNEVIERRDVLDGILAERAIQLERATSEARETEMGREILNSEEGDDGEDPVAS